MTFTIGQRTLDGQPVIWNNEKVHVSCSNDLTIAEMTISRYNPFEKLYRYNPPATTTVTGRFIGRVNDESVNSKGVSFTVSNFSSSDATTYACSLGVGKAFIKIDLSGRVFASKIKIYYL